MPKATPTSRHDDAMILRAIDEHGHRNALLRLDGHHGPVDQALAQQVVAVIRSGMVARAQAREGSARTLLLEAAVAGYRDNPSDTFFPRVALATEPWSVLIGVHVTFERHNDDHTQFLTGVVLGVIGRVSAPRLRVALTCPALSCQPGDVVMITARFWITCPTPAHVTATMSPTSRRAGRPLYEAADVPYAALATSYELALRRKRPSTLQPPVAAIRRSRGATDLYAIADAENIETAPKGRADITRRRTCATCGTTGDAPFAKTEDGRRFCSAHFGAAQLRVPAALAARNRAVSTMWAREVLADPQTVLVAIVGQLNGIRLRVDDVAGHTLLDKAIADTPIPSRFDDRDDDEEPAPVDLPTWIHSPEVREIADRRLIQDRTQSTRRYLIRIEANEARKAKIADAKTYANNQRVDGYYNPFKFHGRRGNRLDWRYRIWADERHLLVGLFEESSYHTSLIEAATPDAEAHVDPKVVISMICELLREMAELSLTAAQEAQAQDLHQDRGAPEYRSYLARRFTAARPVRTRAAVDLFGETDRDLLE